MKDEQDLSAWQSKQMSIDKAMEYITHISIPEAKGHAKALTLKGRLRLQNEVR